MDYWLFVIFISAFIVGLVAYFLWRQFFMRPADASEVGAAGTAPDYYDRREREADRRHTEDQRTRSHEEPGPPLS